MSSKRDSSSSLNAKFSPAALETIALAASIGLTNLQNEPIRLSQEAENVNRELESLVLQNYNIFVENLTCSTRLREEDVEIDEAANELVDRVSFLSQQCSSFKDQVQTYVDLHKRNRKTLQHHMQLVELLEVPQLVDACARNNFHDEAIELASFVNSLERRHLLMTSTSSNTSNNSIKSTSDEQRMGASRSNSIDDTSSYNNNNNNSIKTRDINDSNNSQQQQQEEQDELDDKKKQREEQEKRNGSRVVQGIVDEVQKSLITLRHQLLTELTENTTLSRELHILSILRKLDGLFVDRKLAFERYENLSENENMITTAASAQVTMTIPLTGTPRVEQKEELLKFFETRLQLSFLEARTVWIKKSVDKINNSNNNGSNNDNNNLSVLDEFNNNNSNNNNNNGKIMNIHSNISNSAYGQTIARLELYRSSWLSVVTQFMVLFQDNSKPSLPSAPSNLLLGSWLTSQVHSLLMDLRTLLPGIQHGTSLRTVLEQSLLFAQRMGEVGGDFSGLIVPLFQEILIERVQIQLSISLAHFKSMVVTERFGLQSQSQQLKQGGVASRRGSGIVEIGTGRKDDGDDDAMNADQMVPLFTTHHLENITADSFMAATATTDASGSGGSSSSNNSMTPTSNDMSGGGLMYLMELMMYSPLAYYCNDVLDILNFVRECPMMSARDDILNLIAESLQACCLFIVNESNYLRNASQKYLVSTTTTSSSGMMDSNKFNNKKTDKSTAIINQNQQQRADPLYCIRGHDYVSITTIDLDNTNNHNHNNPNPSSSSSSSSSRLLDRMYALAVVKIMIPHVLMSFDQIFPPSNSHNDINNNNNNNNKNNTSQDVSVAKQVTANNVINGITNNSNNNNTNSNSNTNGFRISVHVNEARSVLTNDCYNVLLTCWKTLEDHKLLPQQQQPSSSSSSSSSFNHANASAAITPAVLNTLGASSTLVPSNTPSSSSSSFPAELSADVVRARHGVATSAVLASIESTDITSNHNRGSTPDVSSSSSSSVLSDLNVSKAIGKKD